MSYLTLSVWHWLVRVYGGFVRLAMAPRRVLFGFTLGGLTLALGLVLTGAMLYQPETFVMAASQPAAAAPAMPANFTPLASPPPAFAPQLATASATPALASPPAATPALAPLTPTGTAPPAPLLTPRGAAPSLPLLTPTATEPVAPPPGRGPSAGASLDAILAKEAEGSGLEERRWVSILLMGTDARPDEGVASRTDTLIVAILDMEAASVTLISIPRDLWVYIPGYGESRINTAYFLGQFENNGAELARQTVSGTLGIPINYTMTLDFSGFHRLVDAIGGIAINVPTAIDDWAYPDENYGTFHLEIPAGPQRMDGERTLQYARTRHGNSDFDRSARQQAIIHAIRRQLLKPEQLPRLPGYLMQGASEVSTTLTLPDLFYVARFLRTLEGERIFTHIIEPPLLWGGVTADGQQVLLYDPYSLQQAIQGWLAESSEAESLEP